MPERRARRVPTEIEIKWGFEGDCPYAGTIINMTVFGCAIDNKEDVAVHPGQVVLIRFWMPQDRLLKVEVVHKMLKGTQIFGAKFLELTKEDKETLKQMVQLFGKLESKTQT
ncbi:MAG: PilZ domain-containing protein [Pyrinomonadaceae bacterium]|nr:PilZ domain-containing protein [Pyrinomonadaceae bacterium]